MLTNSNPDLSEYVHYEEQCVVHMLVSEKTDTHKTYVARVLDISLRILYSNVHYRLDYSNMYTRWKSLTNDHKPH